MPSRKATALITAVRAIHAGLDLTDIAAQRIAQDNVALLVKPRAGTSFKAADGCGVPAAWVRAKRYPAERAVLYCHGGAFMCGTLKYARAIASKIAKVAGVQALAFEYRLAPEHAYPAQLDDTLTAWQYLIGQGFRPQDICVVGESAGGNLALALALALREMGQPLPGRIACLSPWADLGCEGESYARLEGTDPTLSTAELLVAAKRYAGERDLRDPLVSPIYADFTGFPPTLIQAGTGELLMSDAVELHRRMERAGVRASLELWEGMWHVFQLFPIPEAKDAIARVASFINEGY